MMSNSKNYSANTSEIKSNSKTLNLMKKHEVQPFELQSNELTRWQFHKFQHDELSYAQTQFVETEVQSRRSQTV